MGYNIRVDHSQLESTANVIESYISKQNEYMNSMTGEIEYLIANWVGEDAKQFELKWNSVIDSTSTTEKFKSSLKNYASALRYSANQYKLGQANAINRSNQLKW